MWLDTWIFGILTLVIRSWESGLQKTFLASITTGMTIKRLASNRRGVSLCVIRGKLLISDWSNENESSGFT